MADYENIQAAAAEAASSEDVIEDKFDTIKTLTVSSAHAVHDMYSGFLAPLLPFLIERLSLLNVEAGLFLLIYQGASVLQPIIGHIGDTKNLRKYALIMPALTGITLSMLGTAPTYTVALLLCLIAGITSATMHAILPALVAKLSGKQVGRGMGFWMVSGEIGVMVGPILVASVISGFGIKATPWLMIPGIAASIVLSILLKDMPSHNSISNIEVKIPVKALVAIMLPLAGIILMRSPLRTAAEIYLPVYLMDKGVSSFLAGSSVTLLLGFGIIGIIAGGYLKDRFGFKSVMLISIIFTTFFMTIFTLTSGILRIIGLSLSGTTSAMMLPVGLAFIQESFPKNRSLANGVYLAILFALNAIAGVFTGFMLDKIGGDNTFLLGGLINLLGISFIFFLPREGKKA